MSKWVLNRPGVWEYLPLGFVAADGDILDARVAPDSFWSLNGNQAAAETVMRVATTDLDPYDGGAPGQHAIPDHQDGGTPRTTVFWRTLDGGTP